jgi:hypothetical protein
MLPIKDMSLPGCTPNEYKVVINVTERADIKVTHRNERTSSETLKCVCNTYMYIYTLNMDEPIRRTIVVIRQRKLEVQHAYCRLHEYFLFATTFSSTALPLNQTIARANFSI